jgi:hypothetical protein
VILRHDVDLKAGNSLTIAKIEAEMGIRATYYFRIVPQSNQPDIIRDIANMGHEIGYHYEDLALFHGDAKNAIAHFETQLKYFRQFYPVRTICMHGSPTSKWDNRDLWKTYGYKEYGIIGEPYLDFLNSLSDLNRKIAYFTDTARMWNGGRYNLRDKRMLNSEQLSDTNVSGHQITRSVIPVIHSTFDFIGWFNAKPQQDIIMITTHPQRWSNKAVEWVLEFILQKIKNFIKHWFYISMK